MPDFPEDCHLFTVRDGDGDAPPLLCVCSRLGEAETMQRAREKYPDVHECHVIGRCPTWPDTHVHYRLTP